MAQCYALIAACQYAGTPKELAATSEDAAAFSQMLQEDLAVPAENITLMDESGGDRPPTAAAIRKALAWYCGKAAEGDSLLFYFAGHGVSIPTENGPRRALVCCDLDLLTRYDLNTIATAAPEGVKFTIVADASNANELLPHAPINGPEDKEIAVDNTGRKLGPKMYVQMFQQKYPNAGMTTENTMQALRQRFPIAPAGGFPGADEAGGVPGRTRTRRAGPLGEGYEGEGDDEEDEGADEEGRSRRERRRRDDEEGDERRRNRHEREEEEGRHRDDEEEGEPEEPAEEPEEPAEEPAEEPEEPAEEPAEEPEEPAEEPEEPAEEPEEPAEEPEEPAEGEEPGFPGFQPPPAEEDDGLEGDEEEDPGAEAAPDPTDGDVGERGVLFSASFKKSVVADGAGFTVALIAAIRQVKEGGEGVTNRAVIDALMAIMAESNPRMIPTLACCEISAEEPFFGC